MSKSLEDYAIIGDGETVALVAKDGSIDWLCWPRFDSEACFAALLGDESHGHFRIGPDVPGWNVERRYQRDTLVLETEYSRGGNRARLIDFMPLRNDASSVARIVEGISGEVPFRLECAPVFDYGLIPPWAQRETENVVVTTVSPHMMVLRAAVQLELTGPQASANFKVCAGQQLGFVLTYGDSTKPPPHASTPYRAPCATERWWREWRASSTSRPSGASRRCGRR
jgi:GH15 family glucan-1,4-alpha-glucosidase